MDVLSQHLDNRDAAHRADQAARAASGRDAEAEAAFRVWLDNGRRPEERLLKFDTWLRRELGRRLDWTWAGQAREKRIEQCRIHLERLVLQLWQRGWMLDGKRLAGHLQDLLEHVATYQQQGGIVDFWAYFKSSAERYVGQNAEEIREESLRAGSHISQVLNALTAHKPAEGPKMGDLLQQRHEETLRAKLAKERQRTARKQASSDQRLLW